MTYKGIKYEGCKMLIKILEKDVEKINVKLKTNNQKREEHKLSINVKGYEVSKESDLDDLIAGDVINSNQYLKYQKKLRDIQKSVKFNNNEEVLNYVLECLNNLVYSLKNDIYLIDHPEEDWHINEE